MESDNVNICAICSEAVCSSERIALDEDFLRLLKVLFAKIDCSALQNTRACENCLSVIQDACNFKMMYAKEDTLNVAIGTDQTDLAICLCQICKKIIEKSASASFTEELKFVINHLIEEMKTGLEATEDFPICISCEESVLNLHSIVKLLSNLTKNNDHKNNAKICIEQSNNPNKIETNEGLLMDYSNVTNINAIVKNESVEAENIKNYGEIDMPIENKVNHIYEDFIIKNEEVDIKTECERDASAKQMWKSNENVKVNLSNVDGIKMFTCDVCDYETKHKRYLKRHMLKHMNTDEIEMFTCDICEFKTKRKNSIKKHVLIHNNVHMLKPRLKHKNADEIKMFTCDVCDYKTKKNADLKKHMLKHKSVDEVEMFTCDICDFKTKYKKSLQNHLTKAHKNIETKLFTCNVCDYKAKHRGNLRSHTLKHKSIDEVKIFACDICDYKTKYRSSLNNHTPKHKNNYKVKTFRCDICMYDTKRRSCLINHIMLKHESTDTEPFTCDICSFKTNHKLNLENHLEEVHQNIVETEQFTCDVCGYKTNCNSSFTMHMSLHEIMDEGCIQCC